MFNKIRYAYHTTKYMRAYVNSLECANEGNYKQADHYYAKMQKHKKKISKILYGAQVCTKG